ncbi:MAG: CapA family protein [Bacilli bacterium]|nr:CapA family protein [Bacilli bacterium]
MRHKKFSLFAFFLCSLLIITGCGGKNVDLDKLKYKDGFEKVEEKQSNKLSMITAGDALIHSSVYQDAYISGDSYDFTKMLPSIKNLISGYDLKYYNQETIIGGKNLGVSTYPCFNSPDEIADAMLDAGFNIVSLANNHTLDRGERAILYSTEQYWPTKEVMVAGSYNSFDNRNKIQVREMNGIKYTLLSYTTSTNGIPVPSGKDYLVNRYDPEQVKRDIEAVRPYTDVIMVAMHWGEEYTATPVNSQKQIAQYLSDLGVNVIIGTHPHVIEPIEFIGDTLVIYSLGNFISAQIGIDRLVGAMVSYDIIKNDDNGIKIENVKAHLIYTYYNNFRNYYVYPFTELNTNILPNYVSLYEKYSNIIKMYDNSIEVVPLT